MISMYEKWITITGYCFRLGKRAPQLSINQDLHAIANSLNKAGGGSSKILLNRLGKRAPSLSVNADLMAIADSLRGTGK